MFLLVFDWCQQKPKVHENLRIEVLEIKELKVPHGLGKFRIWYSFKNMKFSGKLTPVKVEKIIQKN